MKERKVRVDKKTDIKPFVSNELRSCIYRLAFITDTPAKDVIEEILKSGVQRDKVISYLSQYFLKDIRIKNVVYFGEKERVPVKTRGFSTVTNPRIFTRVSSELHDVLSVFSYAMECSLSLTCTLLIEATVKDTDFVDDFAKKFISDKVDADRMEELKKVLKYINAGNPFDERITWSTLLNHIVEDVQHHVDKVHESVSRLIVNIWNKK